MNGVERVLEHIASKAHLKEWIDALPEGTQVVVITHPGDGDDSPPRFCHMNNPTIERSFFMVSQFANWLTRP